jgi:hypothetical protein
MLAKFMVVSESGPTAKHIETITFIRIANRILRVSASLLMQPWVRASWSLKQGEAPVSESLWEMKDGGAGVGE